MARKVKLDGGRRRRRDRRGKVRGAIRLASAGLAAAAVVRELRLPKRERSWQGSVAGVPYDFRTPTPMRVKRSLWAPDNERIFVPRAFGVGWSVNFAAVLRGVRRFQGHA